MRWTVLIILLGIVFLPFVNAYTFSIRLNINGTDQTVYIPGKGETQADDLGTNTMYSNPPHFYLASYLQNILTGLVAENGIALITNTGESNHSIEIQQDLEKSKIFLVFSRGDWKNIEKRMDLIEKGEFLLQITPTFGWGLGGAYPIKLILWYAELNLTGSLMLGKGQHKLVIENTGFQNERPIINIRKG